MSNNNFYVYVHRRADDNTIFYIGKGEGRRAWRKTNRNIWWKRVVEKHNYVVEVVLWDLPENDAFQLEKELITFYKGHLVNLTDGGEGSSGIVYSIERKNKISKLNTELWKDPAIRKRREEGQRKWAIENWKGSYLDMMLSDPQFQAKRVKALREKHCRKVKRSDGVVFNSIKEAANVTKCDSGSITKACKGQLKQTAGYSWKYV